jgi:hypothetical protein
MRVFVRIFEVGGCFDLHNTVNLCPISESNRFASLVGLSSYGKGALGRLAGIEPAPQAYSFIVP